MQQQHHVLKRNSPDLETQIRVLMHSANHRVPCANMLAVEGLLQLGNLA